MQNKKDRIASTFGSVLEWYDFSLYGFFAPVLASTYFPSENKIISLLKMFSIFAVGFFARPIGAIIFGHISDKYGRSLSLKITPWLITLSTVSLVFIPSYDEIGVAASFFVCLLRIIQGICIGGEYTNSMIYLCEIAPQKKIYFYGSLASCSGSIGILLASTVATFCYSLNGFIYPTWKLAFLSTIIVGVVTILMRKNLSETPVFETLLKSKKINNPFLLSLKRHKVDYLLSVGVTFLPATAFYYVFMFLPSYLTQMAGHSMVNTFGNNSISLFIRLFFIPIFGIIADKTNGLKIAALSAILFIIFSIPLSFQIFSSNNLYISLAFYTMALMTTLNAATTPGILVKLLSPSIRSTVFSSAFNLCFGVFGGITPLLSFYLIDKFGHYVTIYYIIFSAFISLISIVFIIKRGTHGKKLQAYS